MPRTQEATRAHTEQLRLLRQQVQALQEELRRARHDAPDSAAPDSAAAVTRRLEEENRALHRQLRQLQRLAMMGTLNAMVAHEFNNILTPVINYARIAKENPSMADKAIDRAAEGGERACQICEAILGLARGSSHREQVVLRELIEETVAAMARRPQRDAIDLTIDVPDRLQLNIPRVELQQILLNLLINARKSVLRSSGPRRIHIQARQQDQRIHLDVADTGEGIAPENLERIFEPFFTTSEIRNGKSEGTGLGLSICREIIREMGGEISVSSEPGRGASFHIGLPKDA
ncbi:MAG: sensor histidine kinase [Planctomycetota bacterium]